MRGSFFVCFLSYVLAAAIIQCSYGVCAAAPEDGKTCIELSPGWDDAATSDTAAMLQRHAGIAGEMDTKVNTAADEDVEAKPKLAQSAAISRSCANVAGKYAVRPGLADATVRGPWIVEQRDCKLLATLEGDGGHHGYRGEVDGTEISVRSSTGQVLQGHVMPDNAGLTFPALGPGPILVKQSDMVASVLQTRSTKKSSTQPDAEAQVFDEVLIMKGLRAPTGIKSRELWTRSNWTD